MDGRVKRINGFMIALVGMLLVPLFLTSCNGGGTESVEGQSAAAGLRAVTLNDNLSDPRGMTFLPDGCTYLLTDSGKLIQIRD